MSPQVLPPAAQGVSLQQPVPAEQQQQQQAAAPGEVLEVLDAFLAVQRERAAAYRRFDAAFRAYLANQAEGLYR